MPCLSGFELYSRWVSLIYICQKVQRVIVKSSQRVGVLQLFKATILPYSTYSHLIWHFGRASDSRKLDRVLGRVLRAICYDRSSTYEKLLNTANLCTLRKGNGYRIWLVLCTSLRIIFVLNTLLTFSRGQTPNIH